MTDVLGSDRFDAFRAQTEPAQDVRLGYLARGQGRRLLNESPPDA